MMFPVEKVEGVVVLFNLTTVAFLMACFSWFLNHLMDEHPVGQWYMSKIQNLPEILARPLGECVYCSGAWQFLFASYFIFQFDFILCLIGLGISHLLIRVVGPLFPW